jgi:hypothetical protein
MIAARHAVVVDRTDIARDRQGRVELQARIVADDRLGAGGERLGLAQGDPAPRLLPLLHGHPPQGRPEPEHRIGEQPVAHLAAMDQRPASLRLGRWLGPRFPGRSHERGDVERQVAIELGEKIDPRDVVMRGRRKGSVAADHTRVGQAVVGVRRRCERRLA